MTEDSNTIPLDGETDLTPAERKALRAMIVEAERMTWARKKLKVLAPVLVAVVVAVWQLIEWIQRHIRWVP